MWLVKLVIFFFFVVEFEKKVFVYVKCFDWMVISIGNEDFVKFFNCVIRFDK